MLFEEVDEKVVDGFVQGVVESHGAKMARRPQQVVPPPALNVVIGGGTHL